MTSQRRLRSRGICVRLGRAPDDYLLINRWDLHEDERELELSRVEMLWLLEAHCSRWDWEYPELARAVHQLDGYYPWGHRPPTSADISLTLRARLERALAAGELTIIRPRPAIRTPVAPQLPREPPPSVPPPRRHEPPTVNYTYTLKVIDDTGAPVSGFRAQLQLDGTPRMVTTDSRGLGKAVWTSPDPASARALNAPAIIKQLASRWQLPKAATLPIVGDAYRVPVDSELNLEPLRIAPNGAATIVIGRPAVPTYFEVRVVDEIGEPLSGVELTFQLSSGDTAATTAGDGIAHIDALAELLGAVRFSDDGAARALLEQRWAQIRERPWLEPGADATALELRRSRAAGPVDIQAERLHTLIVRPCVVHVRLFGAYFDTSKCFLLPSAVRSMRFVRETYEANPGSDLLIVGHTDTAGQPAYNNPLSVERARAMDAFLKGDVDAWLAWYGPTKPVAKRWGKREDVLMISALPDAASRPPEEGPIQWYQRTRSANSESELRRTLIREYMQSAGATLPSSIPSTVHGCGENFPVEELGDGQRALENRRVELFLFDGPILPAPPALNSVAGSREYPEWVLRSGAPHDHFVEAGGVAAIRVPTRYTLQRTFPKPSALPSLLLAARHLVEHPYEHLVIIGHADPPGSDSVNQTLSLARARAAKAFVCGDAEFFRQRFEAADPLTAWGTEEIQYMLHALELAGNPFYIGAADGFTGRALRMALGSFQLSEEDLAVNYLPDQPTVERLIDRYLGLRGDLPRVPDERVDAVGGGSWHLPRPFGPERKGDTGHGAWSDVEGADLRRIELLLFEQGVNPPAEAFPAERDAAQAVYNAWCDQVDQDIEPENVTFKIRVVDALHRPVPGATLSIEPLDSASGASTSASCSTHGVAIVRAPPGLYQAEVVGAGAGTFGFELHVDERCGFYLILPDIQGLEDATA